MIFLMTIYSCSWDYRLFSSAALVWSGFLYVSAIGSRSAWRLCFPEKTGYWLRCLSFSPCVLPSSTKLSQDSSQGSCWSPRMRTEDHIAQSEHTFTSKSLLAKASHKSSPGLRNGEIDSLLNGKCCKFTLQRSVDGGLENCGHHRNHWHVW